MKEKTKNAREIETKVAKVFSNRDVQFKSFSITKRIPRQEHLAASLNQKAFSKK